MNIFISCVSEKASHRCQAKDMYQSPLFQKAYAYAQSLHPDHIYILSAKYHVINTDQVISPYDLTLNDMSADERKEWAEECVKIIKAKHINFDEKTIFLAGEHYVEYLREYFKNAEYPYDRLDGIGYILHWLDKKIPKNESLETYMKNNIKGLKEMIIETLN